MVASSSTDTSTSTPLIIEEESTIATGTEPVINELTPVVEMTTKTATTTEPIIIEETTDTTSQLQQRALHHNFKS